MPCLFLSFLSLSHLSTLYHLLLHLSLSPSPIHRPCILPPSLNPFSFSSSLHSSSSPSYISHMLVLPSSEHLFCPVGRGQCCKVDAQRGTLHIVDLPCHKHSLTTLNSLTFPLQWTLTCGSHCYRREIALPLAVYLFLCSGPRCDLLPKSAKNWEMVILPLLQAALSEKYSRQTLILYRGPVHESTLPLSHSLLCHGVLSHIFFLFLPSWNDLLRVCF